MTRQKEIVFKMRKLNKLREESLEKTEITLTIIMEQKIVLQKNVIDYWMLEEEIEGIYTLTFKFHGIKRTHNLFQNFSHYQVQKNANGKPVLVRVPK